MINVAEVNRRRCLEESGQWLENVDQTHLLLASEKPVLQNDPKCQSPRPCAEKDRSSLDQEVVGSNLGLISFPFPTFIQQ